MTALHTVLTIIQVLLAVAMVAIVTLQSGKSSGLSSAIAGGDNSFMGKNKSKALDAKLAGATKWIGPDLRSEPVLIRNLSICSGSSGADFFAYCRSTSAP